MPTMAGAPATGSHSYVLPSSRLTAMYAPLVQVIGW
jgi:hypothetical protein